MNAKNLIITFFLILVIGCSKDSKQINTVDSTLILQSHQLHNPPLNHFSNLLNQTKLNYSIEQLDNTKGLSNSSVNTIFQDSQHLLWIGTWDGLNRYDGHHFKIFRPELNNENSLTNQVILKIDEDHLGYIWILTMHGINRYDKKADLFKRYYFDKKNNRTLSESEFNIAINPAKKVYCAVKNWGIGYYNGKNFIQLRTNNLPKKTVKKMEFASNDTLILLYDDYTLYVLNIPHSATNNNQLITAKLISSGVQSFEIVTKNKISMLATDGTASFYSLLDNIKQLIDIGKVESMIGKVADGLVLATKGSTIIINNWGNKVSNPWLKNVKNQKTTILYQGSENIIWTGTDGDGLFKIYPLKKAFNLINKVKVPQLDGAIVRSFAEIKGNSFWVGTKGKGLFKFSNDFYQKPERALKYSIYNEYNSGINNSVFSLCEGKDKLLFIGTDGLGINVFDLKKSKLIPWSQILGTQKCDFFKSTYAIYQDEKDVIWIGTNGYGLISCKIERLNDKLNLTQFKRYVANGQNEKSISSNIIFSIVPNNKDQLWVGTRLGGLTLFNKNSGSFEIYKNIKGNKNSLSSNDILCLHKDAKNQLWIGTSLGLNLLVDLHQDKSATFKSFTVKEGLPSNTIHGIVSDKKSNLWISTNFGLSNFISNDTKFINYTTNQGLQNNEFADGAFYYDPLSNFIFMGGIKGFNYFIADKIKESTVIPSLMISKISGQNQKDPYYQSLVVSTTFNKPPSIALKHNQNFFDIELGALTYVNNEKCQYSYKLENFDKQWSNPNNRRIISFTNVPAGKYQLWLQWSNGDGVWSHPVRTIDITIQPVFWQSHLAFIIYILLLISLAVFIFSYFKKQQSLSQNILFRKKEEELHENRLNFFTEIAHEFQTPLTLIVGPVHSLAQKKNLGKKNRKFIEMIQRNSSRLLFLTQQLLEFRKAEDGHLEFSISSFDLVHLAEETAELFNSWAFNKNINYKLTIPASLIGFYDKDKIEKILFNLLSNAFKYTPINGKILLHLSFKEYDPSVLQIIISNTGPGIPKEKIDLIFERFYLSDHNSETDNNMFRTGIGLAYIKKLVIALKGEIMVSSILNTSTTFTITIPCRDESYKKEQINMEIFPVSRSTIFKLSDTIKSNTYTKKEKLKYPIKSASISEHLKNILEDKGILNENVPQKISSIELIINKRKSILIVEDEKEIHQFLAFLLSNTYTIIAAYNGIEALEKIKIELPDLIISDVMMPLMDGVELCSKIKRDIKTCHIPIILLTAKDNILHRIQGIDSGADSYIAKPFHPDHLKVRIKKLLQQKEFLVQQFSQNIVTENFTIPHLENIERLFIKKLIEIIRNNINNDKLQSLFIEKELGISNSQLYRKIKQIFGITPGDLIRTVRLKYAAELLRKHVFTVSEICYQSGFNNRSYFYREFKKVYQMTPKNYQLKHGKR